MKHVNDRSCEIIKDLNRLANDNSLPPKVRLKVSAAAQHIKNLHTEIQMERPDFVLDMDEPDFDLKINEPDSDLEMNRPDFVLEK